MKNIKLEIIDNYQYYFISVQSVSHLCAAAEKLI